ncbi:mediator of RNA polymerase II transcription subunit 13-like [Procambarus clarkii]|uniref:mediator of RNA polymerase II transcription subunit 13-like n=1 Tax=Procambarus clarkii TaxID=6728 RepID=UPI00374374E1
MRETRSQTRRQQEQQQQQHRQASTHVSMPSTSGYHNNSHPGMGEALPPGTTNSDGGSDNSLKMKVVMKQPESKTCKKRDRKRLATATTTTTGTNTNTTRASSSSSSSTTTTTISR